MLNSVACTKLLCQEEYLVSFCGSSGGEIVASGRDFPCLNVSTGVTSQWVAILETARLRNEWSCYFEGMLEREERSLENRSVFRGVFVDIGLDGVCRQISSH